MIWTTAMYIFFPFRSARVASRVHRVVYKLYLGQDQQFAGPFGL